MKFLHTGDLHIGKVLHEFPLLEDQKYILKQIIKIAEDEKTDAVILAGDIYDRSIPPVEAVSLLDEFLTELASKNILVLVISGNHDSGERLSFMSNVLEKQNIFIAGNSTEALQRIEWEKDGEQITFVLFPFVKPAEAGAKSTDEAVRLILEREGLSGKNNETNHKYVLITHFFVTDAGRTPELSDSESPVHVGGIDNVEASAFSFFDYVALGHIHKPQKIGSGEVYYAGTPLKYSFSETQQEKSVIITEIGKAEMNVRRVPLKPLRDMRKIKGSMEELMKPEVVSIADSNDYIQATLTGKEELIDPIGTLRSVYPNIMQIVLEKNEQKSGEMGQRAVQISQKSTLELFEEFFELLRGEKMDEARREEVRKALEEV